MSRDNASSIHPAESRRILLFQGVTGALWRALRDLQQPDERRLLLLERDDVEDAEAPAVADDEDRVQEPLRSASATTRRNSPTISLPNLTSRPCSCAISCSRS